MAGHLAHSILDVGLGNGVFGGVSVAAGVADSDGLGQGLADADSDGDSEIDGDGDSEQVSGGVAEIVRVSAGLREASGLGVASINRQSAHSYFTCPVPADGRKLIFETAFALTLLKQREPITRISTSDAAAI
jgi:hypothetical protein